LDVHIERCRKIGTSHTVAVAQLTDSSVTYSRVDVLVEILDEGVNLGAHNNVIVLNLHLRVVEFVQVVAGSCFQRPASFGLAQNL
jgi:hypothetical protein